MAAPQIFVSYSSKDQATADQLCGAIETRGFACWISSRDVRPGENFQEAIVRAIRRSKIMVLVFTTNANKSNEIKKEVALASRYGLVVIPARVEDVVPSEAFELEFATRQWIDLFRDRENALSRLTEEIQSILPATETAPPPAVVMPAVASPAVLAQPIIAQPSPVIDRPMPARERPADVSPRTAAGPTFSADAVPVASPASFAIQRFFAHLLRPTAADVSRVGTILAAQGAVHLLFFILRRLDSESSFSVKEIMTIGLIFMAEIAAGVATRRRIRRARWAVIAMCTVGFLFGAAALVSMPGSVPGLLVLCVLLAVVIFPLSGFVLARAGSTMGRDSA